MKCAERKHRGWPVSDGEVETERKERESEGEGWNMGCCQRCLKGYGAKRVESWRGRHRQNPVGAGQVAV